MQFDEFDKYKHIKPPPKSRYRTFSSSQNIPTWSLFGEPSTATAPGGH